MGIDPSAVVSDPDALGERVKGLFRRFPQPVLIEEFIPFGEVTVFLIGNDPPRALPVIQRCLDSGSRLSAHVGDKPVKETAVLCPLELTEDLEAQAQRMALTLYHTLGCRDMARVDLRVSEVGEVFFLEINPLPSFDPEGSLGLLAEHLGTTYTNLVGEILQAALLRLGL